MTQATSQEEHNRRLITIRDDAGKRRPTSVHRLVLEAFVGPCPEGMECRHLDGNPANNMLTNLAWGTRLENAADTKRHGTLKVPKPRPGEAHHAAKLNEDDVRCIRAEPAFIGVNKMLATAFGVDASTISIIRAGKRWAHV